MAMTTFSAPIQVSTRQFRSGASTRRHVGVDRPVRPLVWIAVLISSAWTVGPFVLGETLAPGLGFALAGLALLIVAPTMLAWLVFAPGTGTTIERCRATR